MNRKFKAVYENGVLRPLEPVRLSEHEHVTISIMTEPQLELDDDCLEMAEAEGDDSVTIEEVRARLAAIPGSLSQAAIDDRGDY